MKSSVIQRGIVPFLIAVALASCATSKPVGEWRNENFTGKLDNILVIGVTSRSTRRRVFEDKFVEALSPLEVSAVPSYELITSSMKLSRETVEEAIRGRKIDAVLVTRLAGIREKEVYQRPDGKDENMNYFEYYDNSLQQTNDGYYAQYSVVTLETNLYDSASGELVWSMQSEIIDASQPRHAIEDQIRLTIDTLRAQRLIGE